MLISEVSPTIEKFMAKGYPFALAGEPGIGKTDVIRQVTERLGFDLMISHVVTQDSTHYSGIPQVDLERRIAEWFPFGDLDRAMRATDPLVWFLDDFGQVNDTAVQAACMQLFLGRELNGKKLSDFVTFVVATNRREDKAGVSPVIEPVKSRWVTIINVETCFKDWEIWAELHGVNHHVMSYLQGKPDMLCQFAPSTDLTNSPMPRTWWHAHQVIELELSENAQLECLTGAIGQGAAVELTTNMRRVNASLPSIKSILLDPDKAPIPDEMDLLYTLAVGVGNEATKINIAKVVQYAKRLASAGRGEYGAMALRKATKRDDSLLSTQPIRELAYDNSELADIFRV